MIVVVMALGLLAGAAVWFGLLRPLAERITTGEWRW